MAELSAPSKGQAIAVPQSANPPTSTSGCLRERRRSRRFSEADSPKFSYGLKAAIPHGAKLKRILERDETCPDTNKSVALGRLEVRSRYVGCGGLPVFAR